MGGEEQDARAGPDDARPRAAAAVVDHAILTAQAEGKVLLPEMIKVLDALIAVKTSALRASVAVYGASAFDLAQWGRDIFALESLLGFLERINGDEATRKLIHKLLSEPLRVVGAGKKTD